MILKTVIFVEIHALMEFLLEKNRIKMIEQNTRCSRHWLPINIDAKLHFKIISIIVMFCNS